MRFHLKTSMTLLACLVLAAGCPDDETTEPLPNPTPDVSVDSPPTPAKVAPIFITTMTHLEGGWNYKGDQGKTKFEKDIEKIELGMDTFEKFGALLTIESEIPFASAATQWNNDIFTRILERGHGVGTHCDIKADQPVLPVEEFALRPTQHRSTSTG